MGVANQDEWHSWYFEGILSREITSQKIMRDRKPLELRKAYAAHNWVLSVFSLVCFIGTVYEVVLHSQARLSVHPASIACVALAFLTIVSALSLTCCGNHFPSDAHPDADQLQKEGAVSILCEKDVLPAKGRLYYWFAPLECHSSSLPREPCAALRALPPSTPLATARWNPPFGRTVILLKPSH